MTRRIAPVVPTMPAQELAHRRAQLAKLSHDELVSAYFALPGHRGDQTLFSDQALVEVLAWAGPVDAPPSGAIAFVGADGDLVE